MKFFLAMGILSALAIAAQDAQPTPIAKPKQGIEVAAPQAPKSSTVSTNALGSGKRIKEPKEPAVSYGGVATELRRSTNWWRTFSLRRPVNRKEDDANVIHNLRTEGGGAVKVFSIDF